MEEIKDFLDHEDPIVAEVARDISVLETGFNDGDLTKEQYKELVNDLLEVDEVRRMSSTLERKIKILQAFNTIRTIVGIVLR